MPYLYLVEKIINVSSYLSTNVSVCSRERTTRKWSVNMDMGHVESCKMNIGLMIREE